jgi:predicted HAD superfamily Cof-like phosphohydrolase
MTVIQQRPTYFQQYTMFASACEIPEGHINQPANQAAIALGEKLVIEEWENETKPALQLYKANPTLENLAEVADGIADTIYVLCQLARALDVPLDKVWDAVQAANMRKIQIGPDGKIKKRADGKILKPEGWTPPNIFGVLLDYSNQRAVEDGGCGAENWDEFKKGVKEL